MSEQRHTHVGIPVDAWNTLMKANLPAEAMVAFGMQAEAGGGILQFAHKQPEAEPTRAQPCEDED